MGRITRFEDFEFDKDDNQDDDKQELNFDLDVADLETPTSADNVEPEDDDQQVNGDDDVTIELTPEEEKDMEDVDEEDDHLEEGKDPLLVTAKDIMRIHDIKTKSGGSGEKAKKLAETMCKLITDKWKAVRRARAAEREGEDILADIFMARAKELGAFGA